MKYKLVAIFTALVLLAAASAPAAQKKAKPDNQLEFGVKMAKRGLWAEALFRFQQAEKMGDTRAAVYNNIAVAYEALGVFEKAQEYYKKGMTVDSKNAALRRNYSRFVEFYQSFRQGEEDEATDTTDGATPEPTAGSS
jgi:Tfp pilus assembly protein PilF